MVPALLWLYEVPTLVDVALGIAWPLALLFMAITGVLLVADLKRPERFLWVLLRPQWSSWLVRGAYGITLYNGVLFAGWLLDKDSDTSLGAILMIVGGLLGSFVAAYSGWLFGQAKGRDMWQSALSPLHLGLQAVVAGAAALLLLNPVELEVLVLMLMVALVLETSFVLLDVHGRHSTEAARRAAHSILEGRRGIIYWVGVLGLGRIMPMIILCLLYFLYPGSSLVMIPALLILLGIALWEHLWVEAPQRLPLA